MRYKTSIALAAMAAVLAVPAAAEAKTRKHQATAEEGLSTAEQLRLAQEQISQLQAQLNAISAKLDQNSAAVQAAPAQAAAASQAVAADASARADKALAVATEAKAEAGKAEKGLDLVKWAGNTQVSGRMYFNVSSVSASANGVKKEQDGGLQIKRMYIGIDHKFSDMFSANVTMDVDNLVRAKSASTGSSASATNPSVGDAGTVQGFYVKKAYVDAKLSNALDVKVGVADMPWVPYVEGLYGLRHVEKVSNDLYGYGTSADWGVHVGGKLFDGIVNYQVSAIDGGGYRQPQLTKTIDVEGRVGVEYKGFVAATGFYTGKLGNDTQANEAAGTFYRTSTRFNALLAYRGTLGHVPVTVGGEYFEAKDWKVKTTAAEDKAVGYSLFASVSPVDKWSLFGRYDWVKPNDWTANTKKGQYFNVGLQWEPVKIVDIAVVYKRYDADNGWTGGEFSTSNTVSGTRDEVGIFGQFKF